MNRIVMTACVGAGLVASGVASAQPTMFAWKQSVQGLYTVSARGPSAELFEFAAGFTQSPEIEYAQGVIYMSQTNGLPFNTTMRRFDAQTGDEMAPLLLTFPAFLPDDTVITAMEFVDGVLWGATTREGLGSEAALVTINTTTGQVLYQGPTTILDPITGLAWDGSEMYAVAGRPAGTTLSLYTLDLNTATPFTIGPITVPGIPALQLTAIEFGPDDGPLYALANISGGNSGQLFVVSTQTGDALPLGDMGETGLVSLTTRDSDGPGCNAADLDVPYGMHDFSDVFAFLKAFGSGCP